MRTSTAQKPDTNNLEIEWDACDSKTWKQIFKNIPKSNLIQTIPYALAVRHTIQQVTRFGLIKVKGEVAGLVQIQEVKFLKVLHYILLDRGPLWLPEYNTPENIKAFFEAFQKTFPPRPGRRRRILPEIPASEEAHALLENLGYKRNGEGYASLWLDLSPAKEKLRGQLKQKWRHGLNAAERKNLTVKSDPAGTHFEWLMDVYTRDKKEKAYRGPPPALLKNMFLNFSGTQNALILRALHKNEPVAAILVFIHGTSATYQIGWTNATGRESHAHNLLLWEAITRLKARGVKWFDLGGINDDSAGGVTRFKEGLGGERYRLVGMYR